MDHCLDTDSLVSVASALEWDVPARLDHLIACQECRTRLAQLVLVQSDLAAATPLAELDPATATARVLAGRASLTPAPAGEGEPAPAPAGAGSHPLLRLVATATFLVAAATTLLVITLLAGTPSAPLALTLAGLAGLASIAPSGRWRRT